MDDDDDDDDIVLQGAKPLAKLIFGDEKKARFIYDMSEEEKAALGLFYWGKQISGQKGEVRRRVAAMRTKGQSPHG